ncbi:tetratricopeptide repeat protein, partial [Fibrobacterota bacterium]
ADPRVKLLCARGYILKNQPGQAAKLYEQVYQTNIKLLLGNAEVIRIMFSAKKYAVAGKLADAYLRKDPKDRGIREIQIECNGKSKVSKEKMRKDLGNLMKFHPSITGWWLKLARLDLDAGDTAMAIKHGKKWMGQNLESMEGLLFLLPLLADRKSEKEPFTMFMKELVTLAPDTAHAFSLKMAKKNESSGRLKEAVRFYEMILRYKPDDLKILVKVAGLYEKLNQSKKALGAYKKAFKQNPEESKLQKKYMELAGKVGDKAMMKKSYQDVQAKNPKAHQAQFKLAGIHLKEGNQQEAYKYLRKALKTQPGNEEYQALLPRTIQTDEQVSENFGLLKKLASKSGADAQTLLFCARGHLLNKQEKEAAGLYQKIYAKDKKLLKGNARAIRVLYGGKNYSLAGKMAEDYLKDKPGDMKIREIQVKSYEAGKVKQSKLHHAMGELVKLDPETKDWWLKLARLDLKAGDMPSAVKHGKKWIEKHPGSVEGHKFLLPLLSKEKKESSLHLSVLEKLIELEPKASQSRIRELGILKYKTGDFGGAEKLLAKAVTLYPKDADIWYKLGKIRARPEFKGKGIEELNKAYQLEPKNPEYARVFAKGLKSDQELKSNLRLFKLLGRSSPSIDERLKLAKSYFLNQDYASSAKEWAKLVEADSNFIEAEPMVVECLLKTGQHKKLLPLYEFRVRKDPSNLKNLETILDLYKKGGNEEKYLHTLGMIVELDPKHKQYQLLLAQESKKQGRNKQAVQNYEEWVSRNPKDRKALKDLYGLLEAKKDSGRMLDVLEKIAAAPKASPSEKKRLGLILAANGQSDRAEKLLQASVPAGKFDEEVSYALYKIHVSKKDKAAAAKQLAGLQARKPHDKRYAGPLAKQEAKAKKFSRVVTILGHPKLKPELDRELSFLLLEAYIQTGKTKTAGKYGEELAKKFPDESRESVSLAALLYEQKKTDAAEEILISLRETEPSPKVNYYLGRIAFDKKDWKAAVKFFEEATEHSRKVFFYLGKAYAKTGEQGSALEAYEEYYAGEKVTGNMARQEYKKGNYTAAAAMYGFVVRDKKAGYKAWEHYGSALLEIKKIAEAKAALEKAAELGSRSSGLRLGLAKMHMEDGALDEAEEILTSVTEKKKNEPKAYVMLAEIALQKDEIERAQDYLSNALKYDPGNEAYVLKLGDLYYKNEQWEEAVNVYAPAASKLPEESLMQYAESLANAGKPSGAISAYESLYKKAPSEDVASTLLKLYMDAGKKEKAAEFAAKSGHPDGEKIQLSVAKSKLADGDCAVAEKSMENLSESDEGNAEYFFMSGQCYFNLGFYGKARKQFESALEGRPDYPEALYHLGQCALKLRDAEMAREYFGQLHENPDIEWKAKGYLGSAYAFEMEEEFIGMEEKLQESIESLPTPEAYYLMTKVALEREDKEEAQQWAEEAGSLAKDDPMTVLAEAEVLLSQGRKNKAVKLIENAMEDNDESCDLMSMLAKIYLARGSDKPARSWSKKVTSRCPEKEMPYFYLGKIAHEQSEAEEAGKYFSLYLKHGGDKTLVPDGY